MKYIHINIIAEGQTEMEFCKNSLSHYFAPQNITIDSRCVLTSRNKSRTFRGGLLDYQRAKSDIQCWIKEEQTRQPFFSTMFDLYALPDDFPKFQESLKIRDPYERVAFLEKAMKDDIDCPTFIPYIQLHEFEALLLANPDILLREYPDKHNAIAKLKAIVAEHDNNPEKVNTGRETAPSKRIISLIPEYESNKVSVGAVLAGAEGIEVRMQRCRHFSDWLNILSELSR